MLAQDWLVDAQRSLAIRTFFGIDTPFTWLLWQVAAALLACWCTLHVLAWLSCLTRAAFSVLAAGFRSAVPQPPSPRRAAVRWQWDRDRGLAAPPVRPPSSRVP